MTKDELIELIKECIEETQLEEGVALYHSREKESGFNQNKTDRSSYVSSGGYSKNFYWSDRPDKFVVDFDFTKTRLEDLIVFDNKPVNAYKRNGVVINSFIPYRFKTVSEINYDYLRSNSEISRVYWDRIKKISNLKTSLRRAIKNLKSTDDVIMSSENIEDIKKMITNGVKKFNSGGITISDFDLIIKAPSSAPLNDLILEEMNKYVVNGKPKIITDPLFIKNQIKNIQVDYDKWYRSKYKNLESDTYKQTNLKYLKKFIQSLKDNPDQEFQIKNVSPADLRQYIKNFITINPKISKDLYDDIIRLSHGNRTFRVYNTNGKIDDKIYKAITGGKVLIIDDTVGAYRTLIQTSMVTSDYLKPKYIYSFALLSDWVSK
jgi:hypothetical protein